MHFFFPATAKHRFSMFAILITIVTLVYFGLESVQPPAPLTETPKADQFSLSAAQAQLQKITQDKHPIASAGHTKVREYLLAELTAMGLTPEVHRTFASFEKGTANGQVQNIVVRLAGRNHSQDQTKRAVLLLAHYDAVPTSFGAGDDGVSVIAILQTLRALKAQAPLANDIIALLSDGEEVGLLGASGFAQSHPWMKDVGIVLNFDNRGNAGPVMMFEPSAGNGKLIASLAQAVPGVISNSMMYEVYKALPNDTDFTVFRKQGVPGLNFAMIQNISSYHTRYDRADLISPASQQQQGQMMLQLARHFGNQDLSAYQSSANAEDHVYFSFPLLGLVHYPANFALTLALIIAALSVAVFWMSRKRSQVRIVASLGGAVSFILIIVGIGFLTQQAWNLVFKLSPAYLEMHDQDTGHYYLLGVLVMSAVIFGLWQRWLTRWIRAKELAFGAAMVWIILLFVTSYRFPGASFLFAWPLAAVMLSWLGLELMKCKDDSASSAWIYLAGGAFAIILSSPLVLLFNIALGFHSLGVPVILFILFLGLVTPLLVWILQELRARIFLIAGAFAFAFGAIATENFHQAHPIPKQLVYIAMPQQQHSFWLAPQRLLDRKTLTMFNTDAIQRTVPEVLGKESARSEWKYWVTKAPDVGIAAPSVRIVSDQILGDQREIVAHISSPDQASNVRIQIEGGKVLSAKLQDQILSTAAKDKWVTSVHAMAKEGVTLRFQIAKDQAPNSMKIRATDTFYVMPASAKNLLVPTGVDLVMQTVTLVDIP
ncbi:M28 family peptidase [Undibacterium seohonense]|uniref:Vacuolar membrane protease n=1 Tax=Undibacterium seohonense TaxID=1344950 RepID=A0ABR6X473_9BURK|nr:M28 family peptidase [Undibacterium seohonense]MBC3807645.1 M28 family peptidase [Undibacterium seohonense]